jgi:hypothetical protein
MTQNMRDAQAGKMHSWKAVRLDAREECAQVADQMARRRSFMGDEGGADASRQIAQFIREDKEDGQWPDGYWESFGPVGADFLSPKRSVQ